MSSFLAMGRYEVGKGGNPHVHGFCVGKPVPSLGGKVIMDIDGPAADERDVDVGSDGAGVAATDDVLSVGAASAGVESANLSVAGSGFVV